MGSSSSNTTDTTSSAVKGGTLSRGGVPKGLIARAEAVEHCAQLMKKRSRFREETDNS